VRYKKSVSLDSHYPQGSSILVIVQFGQTSAMKIRFLSSVTNIRSTSLLYNDWYADYPISTPTSTMSHQLPPFHTTTISHLQLFHKLFHVGQKVISFNYLSIVISQLLSSPSHEICRLHFIVSLLFVKHAP